MEHGEKESRQMEKGTRHKQPAADRRQRSLDTEEWETGLKDRGSKGQKHKDCPSILTPGYLRFCDLNDFNGFNDLNDLSNGQLTTDD